MPLPDFTSAGLLPPGDYPVTIAELRDSFLVRGPHPPAPLWDARWRALLIDNLAVLVRQLRAVGISDVYVGGSFVERAGHPNDIDGYFDVDAAGFAAVVRRLNRLDPHKVWNWSTGIPLPSRPAETYAPMRHHYRVHLEPHLTGPLARDSSLPLAYSSGLAACLRTPTRRGTLDRTGMPVKGVLKIVMDDA